MRGHNNMKFKKRPIIIGVVVVSIMSAFAMVVTYPLWLDSDPLKSVNIYVLSHLKTEVPISSVFPVSKLYCAIGPYDSFRDVRFRKYLSSDQARLADSQANAISPYGQGGTQFLLIGVLDQTVNFAYRSVYFNKATSRRQMSVGEDCVGPTGQLVVSRLNDGIYIGLKQER